MKESRERESIKSYLLGDQIDENARQQIERRLMTDDVFAEELAICEDELIDDYLDGRLNRDEQSRFENHFLLSPEVRERLQFARAFRTHLAELKDTAERKRDKITFFAAWRSRLVWTPISAVSAVLLIVIAGFGVWYFVFRESHFDQGVAALQRVYAEKRSLESRVVGINYSPLIQTRGGVEDSTDALERERAKTLLLQASRENKNAEALHALGAFYLLEKDFDKAVEQLEQAARLAPENAKLHNDLGAAYLEIAKKSSNGEAKQLESLDKSLKHLEEAIELDSRLLEPRFNRALNLREFYSIEAAKQAWREYLELDSNSKWSEEARRNLESLESKKPQNRTAAELERDFLIAFRQNNEEGAWRLLSRNRELIALRRSGAPASMSV